MDNNINGMYGGSQNIDPPKIMDKTNQDIVRLIGQHLKTVGLKYVYTEYFIEKEKKQI